MHAEWRGWDGCRGPGGQALREEVIRRLFELFDELDCPPMVGIEACATIIGVAIGKSASRKHEQWLAFVMAEIERVGDLLRKSRS